MCVSAQIKHLKHRKRILQVKHSTTPYGFDWRPFFWAWVCLFEEFHHGVIGLPWFRKPMEKILYPVNRENCRVCWGHSRFPCVDQNNKESHPLALQDCCSHIVTKRCDEGFSRNLPHRILAKNGCHAGLPIRRKIQLISGLRITYKGYVAGGYWSQACK